MQADDVYAILGKKIRNLQISGGGITDYGDLEGKPQINGVTLQGNLTSKDLGIPTLEIMNEASGTPVGEIISYMGTVAPPNYLICDGAEYTVADYPYLAQHFTDNFGSAYYFGGAGEKFSVPDLRAEFLRGAGTARRDSGTGGNVGEHQDPSLISDLIDASNIGNINAMTIAQSEDQWSNNAYNNLVKNEDKTFGGTSKRIMHRLNWDATWTDTVPGYADSLRPTNTSVLYCIKCKPTFGTQTQHNYSFEEHIVGTWIDGKPLYEKTIDFGSLPNNDTKSVPHGIDNAGIIYVYDGYVYTSKSSAYSLLPNVSPILQTSNWCCWVSGDDIYFITGTDRSGSSAIVTLRYTKTTD